MKKLDTLKKMLETLEENELNAKIAEIIDNDAIIVKTLTDIEKLAVLEYAEIAKAINNKQYSLVLDCNFEQSRSSVLKVDVYKLAIANCDIQVYVKKNHFNIYTSASEANRDRLENELKYTIKTEKYIDKKTQKEKIRYKTSYKLAVKYEDLVNEILQLIALLKSTATEKQQ